MHIRTMVEADLDRVRALLADQSVNNPTVERFDELTATKAYRPEWTWVAEQGGTIVGMSLWWGFPEGDRPLALDGLYADLSITDPVPLWTDLITPVFRTVGPRDEQPQYHIFLSSGWRSDPAVVEALTPRLAAAAAAGLSETLERLRYEWLPEFGAPARSTRLSFRAEPDDEAFVSVFRRVAEGSLDANTRASMIRKGAEGYAREELEHIKMMPGPREWWRLACDGDGELVGFGIPSANANGPVVGFLGVLPEHRGHGYVDDILAEITAFLAATGAQRIVADTDITNRPMAASFERAGYRNFAIRLVASRPAT